MHVMSANQSCAIIVCVRLAKQEKTTASTARGIYNMTERKCEILVSSKCQRCKTKNVQLDHGRMFFNSPIPESMRLSCSYCWPCEKIILFERRKFVPKPYKECWRPLKEEI